MMCPHALGFSTVAAKHAWSVSCSLASAPTLTRAISQSESAVPQHNPLGTPWKPLLPSLQRPQVGTHLNTPWAPLNTFGQRLDPFDYQVGTLGQHLGIARPTLCRQYQNSLSTNPKIKRSYLADWQVYPLVCPCYAQKACFWSI